jgi:hypothetical protein
MDGLQAADAFAQACDYVLSAVVSFLHVMEVATTTTTTAVDINRNCMDDAAAARC